jgi:hypothetical protein
MAREGRNEDNQVQHRPEVLRRSFWIARQLDLVLPGAEPLQVTAAQSRQLRRDLAYWPYLRQAVEQRA